MILFPVPGCTTGGLTTGGREGPALAMKGEGEEEGLFRTRSLLGGDGSRGPRSEQGDAGPIALCWDHGDVSDGRNCPIESMRYHPLLRTTVSIHPRIYNMPDSRRRPCFPPYLLVCGHEF